MEILSGNKKNGRKFIDEFKAKVTVDGKQYEGVFKSVDRDGKD